MPTLRFKIIVIGDGGAGKTTLILRYTEKRFRESYIPTIGVQWVVKTVESGDKTINLTLWDIAGQDKFKTMRSNFYDGADAVIIVFDVTNLVSFDHVENWLREVQQFSGNIPFILLGNKIDLGDARKVTPEMIKQVVEKLDFPYFETSAKTGENVIDMFNTIIEQIQQFEGIIADIIESPLVKEEETINLSEEIVILEEMIKNNEVIEAVNKEFKVITNELFRQNPYHEKLEEMTQWRLENLNPFPQNSNLSSTAKEGFLTKIKEWKGFLSPSSKKD